MAIANFLSNTHNVHKNLIKKSGQKIISMKKPRNDLETEIFKNSRLIKNISNTHQLRAIN